MSLSLSFSTEPSVHLQKPEAIAFIRRGFSSSGGAEAYLQRLARGIQEKGYRTLLLHDGSWPKEAWPGEKMIALQGKNLSQFAAAVQHFLGEHREELLLSFSLERIPGVDLFRAGDGVHAAWLDYRRNDSGNFWWQRWQHNIAPYLPHHRTILKLEKELFGLNSKTEVIVNSKMVAAELSHYCCFSEEKRAKKIHLIYNGVPEAVVMEVAERIRLRKIWGVGEDDFLLLFVGSGWERKGLQVAFEAVSLLEKRGSLENSLGVKMHFWIAGRGKKRGLSQLKEVSSRFLGSVSRQKSSKVVFTSHKKDVQSEELSMGTLYQLADAFILPTRYDPFSNASLEALAAGLPVITTARNGIAEVLEEDVTGSVITDPSDFISLAKAIEYWYKKLLSTQDASVRTAIHERCRKAGAAFRIERNVKETLALIESLLGVG